MAARFLRAMELNRWLPGQDNVLALSKAESGSSEGWYGRPGATYLDVPRRHHHRQMRVPLCHLDIVGDALDALDAVREFAERRGDQHFF